MDIYGKDYATGRLAEDFVDAVVNMQKTTSEHVLLGSSCDEEEGNVSGNQTQMGESAPPPKRAEWEKTSKGKESKESDDISSKEASFQYFMKEINLHLSTMASAIFEANAREKEEADQKNKVLSELLALEGITPDQAYDVAEILTAEPHKLNLFFHSPDDLKPFFVKRVLCRKENRNA